MEVIFKESFKEMEAYIENKLKSNFGSGFDRYEVLLFRRHTYESITDQEKLLKEYTDKYKYNIENYGNDYYTAIVDVLIFKELNPITNSSDHMYVAIFSNGNLFNTYSISFDDLKINKEKAPEFYENVISMKSKEGDKGEIQFKIREDFERYFERWIRNFTDLVGSWATYYAPCSTSTVDYMSMEELFKIIEEEEEEE